MIRAKIGKRSLLSRRESASCETRATAFSRSARSLVFAEKASIRIRGVRFFRI